ncbi:MAG: endonuclease MutS2 [Clostridiales bacterium]|nr:endonuclease MutS2 [Clostridiales bacterium]
MPKTNRHYQALELDKILARLADLTACQDAHRMALELEPESKLDSAGALLAQTNHAYIFLARSGGPSFGGLKNVDSALNRAAAGSVLSMSELMDIGGVLKVIRSLVTWHKANSLEDESVLDFYFESLEPNKFLEEAIGNAIISEEEMADKASPLLADIRRKIRLQETKARELLEKYTRSQSYSKYLQDNIITMRNGRYVVPVKNEHRGDIPGLLHDTSASGATVFIEPMPVVEANNEIRILKSRERDEMERILAQLSAAAGEFAPSISNSYECALDLNLIFAKANLAYGMKASPPLLNDKGIINIRKARHPLIDPKSVVAVDIRLGEDFDSLVITGPNTGGKTVSIKTIGLLTLMAMCGLFIPAGDRSQISVFDRVLADIGDEQSIEQSLSTFSGHMKNIVDIIDWADEKSLVLIDELGAGTDPIEGAALAMAILEALRQRGAKIAATTHYAELKAYALQTPRVENGACEFDLASLQPTYRLLIGVPGRSNAFAISQRLGMSAEIVDTARELVASENIRFEDVVDKLESSRKAMEEEKQRAKDTAREAEQALAKAKKMQDEAKQKLEEEMESLKADALRQTEMAKREAYRLLDRIEKLNKEKDKAKDTADLARRARAGIKKSVEAIDRAATPIAPVIEFDEDYVLPRELEVGDRVLISQLAKEATVLATADNRGNIEVMAGSAKMRIKLEDLRLIEEPKDERKLKSAPRSVGKGEGQSTRQTMAADTSLDLRGMYVEDCLIELDRFIDSSLRTGLSEFTIVHGKGTGALRRAVREYLNTSPFVKSHRLGVFGEGEDGVTIVSLK